MNIGCKGKHDSVSDKPLTETKEVRDSRIHFEEQGRQSGLNHSFSVSNPEDYEFPKVMGSGCAVLDINNDSLLDLLFLGGDSADIDSESCYLYQQLSTGSFELIEESGLQHVNSPMGVAAGDVNNDGAVDLYISTVAEDFLFLNDSGRFVDVTKEAGVSNPQWGASCTFLDFDRDGWLDLFVTNYVVYQSRTCIRLAGGDQDFCGPQMFPDTVDRLFRNVGANDEGLPLFEDVTDQSGIGSLTGPGLGVAAVDFTNDGWADIYVANDQASNVLWVNQKDGTFVNEAAFLGCDVSSLGKSQASMGVAVGDINNDQLADIVLTHLEHEKHAAYLSDKQGFYVDRADQLGIGLPSLPVTGFGAALEDFDADGDLDLFTVNGHVKRPASTSVTEFDFWKPYRQFPQVLEHVREGFEECHQIKFQQRVGRGLACGDLNRDGALDLIAVNVNESPSLFENGSDLNGNWLTIRLVDPMKGSRDAIGAFLKVTTNNGIQSRTLQPGTSYMSSNASEVYFAFGAGISAIEIQVLWPDGSMHPEIFEVNKLNRHVVLSRGKGVR